MSGSVRGVEKHTGCKTRRCALPLLYVVALLLVAGAASLDPGVAYAFIEPQEGRQEIMYLHLALNADILSVDENARLVSLKADAAKPDDAKIAAYTPHITIGRSASAPEMRAVLQNLRRQEIAMKARIDTLTLIDVGLGRIRELGVFGLGD